MIFTKFSPEDIVLGRTTRVSSGFWSDGNYAHSQSLLFTSSTQVQITASSGATSVLNGLYYFNVYNSDPATSVDAQVHFSVAYGNYYGSGSGDANSSSLASPTKAIYSTYKNILLTPTDNYFSFKTGSYTTTYGAVSDDTYVITGSSIYAIAFSSNIFKDQIDAGQLEFSLSGSGGQFTFIDDSSLINTRQDVYNIVSGSIVDGVPSIYKVGDIVNYQAIGLLYPKTGIVILDAVHLSSSVGIQHFTGNTGAYKVNQQYLYSGLTRAASKTLSCRKSEFLPSRHYFVRVKNQAYNYSNNPSFVSDGTDGLVRGTIKIPEFSTDPKTYITTVGLYDDSNELIAVAKLSQPTQKSFDSELLLRCRIDF